MQETLVELQDAWTRLKLTLYIYSVHGHGFTGLRKLGQVFHKPQEERESSVRWLPRKKEHRSLI